MITYNVSDIKPNSYYTSDLMIDNQFLICTPAFPITEEVLKALADWNFKELQSEGNVGLLSSAKENAIAGQKKREADTATVEESVEEAENESEATSALKEKIAMAEAKSKALNNESSRMEVVQAVYDEYSSYIRQIFTHYATHKELNLGEISATVKDLCIYIKDNRSYILRISPSMEARNKDFLVSHSLRTTVLAITIGLQLRMPLTKLVELGVACILHEIGMLKLPPQIYMNEKPLTIAEKNQITTHPIIGYNILKDAQFPLSIQLGVLEHHERETGTGYPRHITGEKISLYAKIIAVACSYEAITAPRQFKEARTTYEAMIEMLKNMNHQYDDTVVKALLLSVSLYPIGAYVYLSNGRIAQVIDVNPGNPKNPIVQVVGMSEPDGSPKKIQTDDTTIKIIRVMNKQEVSDVLKHLG